MQFENTLTTHAPSNEVFTYLARPENLPRWNYALDHTEQTSPGPIGVGSTCRQTRAPAPGRRALPHHRVRPPGFIRDSEQQLGGRIRDRPPTASGGAGQKTLNGFSQAA